MAAPLPAINIGANAKLHKSAQSPPQENNFVSSAPHSAPNKIYLKPLKSAQGKRERESAIKRAHLRAQQPLLTKPETTAYRNTFFHNLCLDMLQDGYHLTFSEIFALINRQRDERERAGPDSALWNKTLLEFEYEKLDMLKQFLSTAEDNERQGDLMSVYNSQLELARYFNSSPDDDKWLSDHFFEKCLVSSEKVQGDDGKTLSEAHCNLGLALENNRKYPEAAEHFIVSYDLVKPHQEEWKDENGEFHFIVACRNLKKIYTRIGDNLEATDPEQSIQYLLKAHEKSQESGEKKLEAEASFRLGLGYERNKMPQKALHFLKRYYDMCKAMEDMDGLGLACEAIARAYEKQDQVEESIRYLEQFVEVAEKSGHQKAESRACSDLGAVFNSLSRYEEATTYFTRAYKISLELNDKEAISASRVQYGVAMAHKMLTNISSHIKIANKPCLERMVEWKNSRTNEFSKPLPEQTPQEPKPDPEPKQEDESKPEEKKDEDAEKAAEEEKGEKQDEDQPETAEES